MFDVLVIGGGPAGVSAAIYAKRAGSNVAIIERACIGGQLNLIDKIENYAGFKCVSGIELATNLQEHAQELDIPIIYDDFVNISESEDGKIVECRTDKYVAKAVVLALGNTSRELGIEGEQEFKGNGVSYCAVCDGRFFKGKNVAVVGSGDSAFSDALYLSSLCQNVFLLTKSDLKLHNYTFSEAEDKNNITVLSSAISKKINGNVTVESLTYEKDGEEKKLDVDAVFVAIGRKPDTKMLEGKIQLNEKGYIIVDDKMQTSMSGVYACGDVVQGNMKQVSIAVGQGAVAGNEANKYVLLSKRK